MNIIINGVNYKKTIGQFKPVVKLFNSYRSHSRNIDDPL